MSLDIIGCTFTGNGISDDSVVSGLGGAIYNEYYPGATLTPIIRNCLFEGNVASYGGGAIANMGTKNVDDAENAEGTLEILNSVFRNNTASCDLSTIENETFIGGGAVVSYNDKTETNIINCTFAGNLAGDVSNDFYGSDAVFNLTNTIFTDIGWTLTEGEEANNTFTKCAYPSAT